MERQLEIAVAALDAPHRRALEEVIGQRLAANQRLIISIMDATGPSPGARPAQTLDQWAHVYDGLSDEAIEDIDATAKARADLTRELP